jgi:hypothetical protein
MAERTDRREHERTKERTDLSGTRVIIVGCGVGYRRSIVSRFRNRRRGRRDGRPRPWSRHCDGGWASSVKSERSLSWRSQSSPLSTLWEVAPLLHRINRRVRIKSNLDSTLSPVRATMLGMWYVSTFDSGRGSDASREGARCSHNRVRPCRRRRLGASFSHDRCEGRGPVGLPRRRNRGRSSPCLGAAHRSQP